MTEEKKQDEIQEQTQKVQEENKESANGSSEDAQVDEKEQKESSDKKTENTEKGVGKQPKSAKKRVFRKRKKAFTKRRREERQQEFEQKIISLRRVTRVVAGGRRFSFSAFVIIGNKQGKVGIGIGKSNDASNSIQKAVTNAKKNLVKIKLTENGSIPYDVQAKFKASEVIIRPIVGKGLAVGGAVRTVLELAGVKEGGGKILSRSKNHINNAQATLKALSPFTEKVEYVEKKFTRKKPFKKRRFIKRTNKKENK